MRLWSKRGDQNTRHTSCKENRGYSERDQRTQNVLAIDSRNGHACPAFCSNLTRAALDGGGVVAVAEAEGMAGLVLLSIRPARLAPAIHRVNLLRVDHNVVFGNDKREFTGHSFRLQMEVITYLGHHHFNNVVTCESHSEVQFDVEGRTWKRRDVNSGR